MSFADNDDSDFADWNLHDTVIPVTHIYMLKILFTVILRDQNENNLVKSETNTQYWHPHYIIFLSITRWENCKILSVFREFGGHNQTSVLDDDVADNLSSTTKYTCCHSLCCSKNVTYEGKDVSVHRWTWVVNFTPHLLHNLNMICPHVYTVTRVMSFHLNKTLFLKFTNGYMIWLAKVAEYK
jgi:hypothetical protein